MVPNMTHLLLKQHISFNSEPIEKRAIKEMGSKVDCFAGFYHHPVPTTNSHMHAYRYPLFKSGTKTDP